MVFLPHLMENEYDSRFKIFHELMSRKIREVLLVSTPYDAWIMEEDGRLSERIINEYRGLNLSHPPRLTWVSSAEAALAALERKSFDMVVTMPRLAGMDASSMGAKIKLKAPGLPVIMLAHSTTPTMGSYQENNRVAGIDRVFAWSGNTDILLALIKSAEDRLNVEHDTRLAGIRVILCVEDSPAYLSSLLPILYKELVMQTQGVIEEGLNEEHRLLTMRARPKILVASDFEEATWLYEKYEPYIIGVISDVRYERAGGMDDEAGIELLRRIKRERFDIPLLLTSSDAVNAAKAASIPASFVDKNSASLLEEVHDFFMNHLGFGAFVFRMPDGREVARAANMRMLEKILPEIPKESFYEHCNRNDFSRWLFARTEIVLASRLRPATAADFENDMERMREFIIANIHERRKRRQKGVVANFDPRDFDLDTEFFKIGKGSLGGKARGLAFVSNLLQRQRDFQKRFEEVEIFVPQTLVLTTEGFDAFIDQNDLKALSKSDLADAEIAAAFQRAAFPQWIVENLRAYLAQVHYPLAIRSSSLLEDAMFRAYAGLYSTYMIPNDHPSIEMRLEHLLNAVRLVYASTYFEGPRAFSKRVGHRTEEEKMAVVIQKMVGHHYGSYYYPVLSGVAQSHNYYPFAKMKPEEGIANIAMGLGKIVMEGEKTLRFSPKYPQLLPQRSTVEDILKNAQRYFYALEMGGPCCELNMNEESALCRREVTDAEGELPLRLLADTYVPEENRIRSGVAAAGYRVLSFDSILKHKKFPLAELLQEVLALGQEGMGCPVELEFSLNFGDPEGGRPEFAFLQLRPMKARAELETVDIAPEEFQEAFCRSTHALGNTVNRDLADIIYVKPDVFDAGRTVQIAQEIGRLNGILEQAGRKYLLIGPGRWGSADRWLGIPVRWADICGVGAVVETSLPGMRSEPSQGSHFFHNISTMGVNYITVRENDDDLIDWQRLTAMPVAEETPFVAHVHLERPLVLKVDGRTSRCVVLLEHPAPEGEA